VGAYWEHWRALPFWPSGPPWFLWQLLVLNIAAAAVFRFAPAWGGQLGRLSAAGAADPLRYFAGLAILSAIANVPLALALGTVKSRLRLALNRLRELLGHMS
jgi:glucan biosynthesis protein C